ncbi:MAG TPA: hypothetical protein VNJ07_10720 [Chitinophagales bacterium]|nr:hypothetical protein [Chitinophagales bacterium]
MSNQAVRKFQSALQRANGNEEKMKEVFKSITDYLAYSISKKKPQQKLEDYLSDYPEVREVHEWSDTVLVNSEYELVNY